MLKRKIIDYRITEPNPELFVRLGNLFPLPNTFYRMFYGSELGDFTTLGHFFLENFQLTKDELVNISNGYISGRRLKTVSNYLCNYMYNSSSFIDVGGYYTLETALLNMIGQYILTKYSDKWLDLLNTFKLDYDPIKPYDMTISEKDNTKHGGSTETSLTGNDTNTRIGERNRKSTDNDSENNVSETTNDSTKNSVYGFNSTMPVPSDVSEYTSKTVDDNSIESSSNSTETTNDTDTFTKNRSSVLTHGRTVDEVRDIIRKGNIGNIAQQDLIRKERELAEYVIWDTIYNDLDRVLTRSKYIIGE